METDSSPVRALTEGPAAVTTRLFRYRRLPRVAVIAKVTLDLIPEAEARLSLEPEPIHERPRSLSSTRPSSVDRPSDRAPFLPCASVLLVGHARAPGGVATPSLATRLVLVRGATLLDKRVHVIGDRAHANAEPEPFMAMPLVWERAFGGPFFAPNPLGRGLDPREGPRPNLEDPTNPGIPAVFAPIPAHWAARRALFDAAPASALGPSLELPDAFDFRYFSPASPDLQCTDLQGGDWLFCEGTDAELAVLRTRLPHLRCLARLEAPDGRPHEGAPFALVADTLLIDADTRRATLTFRGNTVLPEVVAYADIVARVALDRGEGEARWHAEPRASSPAPSSAPLATEPPPPAPELTEVTTADTKRLAAEMAAARLRPLAPFPVANPRTPSDASAPIPGAPWAPAAEPPAEAPPASDPSPAVEDPGSPGFFDQVARARHLAAGEPPAESTRDEPPPALPSSLTEPEKPPPPPATGLRAEVLAAIAAGQSLAGRDLSGAHLDDIDFRGVALARAVLRRAHLKGARLAECEIEGADLSGAELAGASFDGARLTGANLAGALGPGATFRDARATRGHFQRGEWDGAVFDGAELTAADFSAASLQAASFRSATLADARFDGARASRVDLTAAHAEKLRAVGATFDQGTFARAGLEGAILEKASLVDASFFQAKLRGAGLVGARCAGADFSSCDLAEARLRQAELGGARFDEAILRAAKLQRVTGQRTRFVSADLEGADLRHATLPAADFANAQLRKAWMDNAELAKARFVRADLRKASLRAAKLVGASFAHGTLEGADLRDADLSGANFRETRWEGAKTTGAKMGQLADEDAERFDREVRGGGSGSKGEP